MYRSGYGACRRRHFPAANSNASISRAGCCRSILILLLDEPTASLDADNRAVVVDIVRERKRRGAAIVAIVHDDDVRDGNRR